MSEPKLVSPLLDGFLMGDPMSVHDGIACCPAMKENSDDKYIVKIISTPASQVQLDALLLTGAYKDPAAAMEYFKALSDGIVKEAEILQKLSQLEGFVSFESWQVEPMDKNLGYQVYLLSPYRQSLSRYTRRNPVTHLNAVNLGMDLCAALSVCRSSGYLYVDLRPSNIYLTGDKGFRIGDLGFVSLDSLKYTSLPSKYLSPYTPPEMHDPMATVNTTADIYALGMVLYQIYNNGTLPFEGCAPAQELPSPLNADYEIAEIIMKAITPDPGRRWQDPAEMGQALVAYMQRNVINDVPISPPMASILVTDTPDVSAPEAPPVPEGSSAPEAVPDDTPQDTAQDGAQTQASTDAGANSEPGQPPVTQEPSVNVEDDNQQTRVIPSPSTSPKPKFHFFEDDEENDEEDEEENDGDGASSETASQPRTEDQHPQAYHPRKKKTGLVVMMVVLLVLAAVCYGGYYFYKNVYQLTVNSLEVSGQDNQIFVSVDADMDMSLLTVVCSDSYGNTKRQTLVDGKTVFTDLSPDTMYLIQLEVSGYHELLGSRSGSYTTAAETKVTDFVGTTGAVDGSVILEFSVDGPESEWILHYSAEDEQEQTLTFSGHKVNVNDLTVGKTYTFTLEPAASLYLVDTPTLEYTACALVLAEDLKITACSGGELTVQWTTPEGADVESWEVHCYGSAGYDSTVTTGESTLTFADIDPEQSYTVEVKAQGMTQYVWTSVTANAITVGKLSVDEADPEKLVFSWEYEGDAPSTGWLMLYSIDGSEEQSVVQCSENQAEVSPRIPGATYTVTIQAADATTVFTTDQTYTCPDAAAFSGHDLSASMVVSNLLVTPKTGWSYKDVSKKNYTTSFSVGQSISILMHATRDFWLPRNAYRILYVIRDSQGNVLTDLIAQQDAVWYDLWIDKKDYHYCELDIPNVPDTPGSYTVDVYFNGYSMCSLDFTIS